MNSLALLARSLIFLCFVGTSGLYAQLSISFSEPLPGTNPLWSFTLENASDKPVSLGLRVSEQVGGRIAQVAEASRVTIPPGYHTPFSLGLPTTSSIQQFPATHEGGDLSEICVELILETGERQPHCRSFFSPGKQPPMLVFPFDGDTIDGPVPSFSWLPPTTLMGAPGLSYSLKMVEIRRGQNKESAIGSNPSLIRQEGLPENIWNYPMSSPAFEPGKSYAWQVLAFVNGQYYGRSEVWEFVAKESKPIVGLGASPMFWDIDRSNGGIYEAKGYIGIMSSHGFDGNAYEYHILKENGREVKVSTDQIRILNRNQVQIVLPAGSGLRPSQTYSLQVTQENQVVFHIPFTYIFSE